MSSEAFAAQQRYQAIRKQLDQLHYCLPFNQQSTALVEKLLNDLLQTTEGYQKMKHQIDVIKHDENLNQQALVPLTKENERLVKENNTLHHQLIQLKDERDSQELKWRQILRQQQDECRDLKFLADSKDQKIRNLDADLVRLRIQMQQTLERIYLPKQDQVVEGLSKFNENSDQNLLQWSEQNFEVSKTVQKAENVNVAMNNNLQVQEILLVEKNLWAQEMRKADERCEQLNQIVQEQERRLREEILFTQELQKSMKVRDDEILRLHDLYMPAQNLEKINLKYQYQQNEEAVRKLTGQIDFLNKENEKLQRMNDILKGDEKGNLALVQYDQMTREIKDLQFELKQTRADYEECQKLYKQTLDQLHDLIQQEEIRNQYSRQQSQEMELTKRELEEKKLQTYESQETTLNLKSAFNADRAMLQNKIDDLERKLTQRINDISELKAALNLKDQSDIQQKNELNFYKGKISTLRRDLEYQQTFAENIQDQMHQFQKDVQNLTHVLEMKEKELVLQKKESAGLRDDNERLNRMYLLVQKEAFTKPVDQREAKKEVTPGQVGRKDLKSAADYASPYKGVPVGPSSGMLAGANTKKNAWQVVDDGFGYSNDISQISNIHAGEETQFREQAVTMKRPFI